MPLLRSTLTSPQKSPLVSHRSVARHTKLRRRRSYVDGCIFLLASYNQHYDRIIMALILIALLHSRSSQYIHVQSICSHLEAIICVTEYSIRQFISCAYLFHQLRATRGYLARNTRICLYNPYVIVHLKSQKRQIFRYGGSNILGVYQNNSDFFQVCEQILLFYYFGSVATHGHIAGKRKRPAAFASHPHTPGNREYNTARPA